MYFGQFSGKAPFFKCIYSLVCNVFSVYVAMGLLHLLNSSPSLQFYLSS